MKSCALHTVFMHIKILHVFGKSKLAFYFSSMTGFFPDINRLLRIMVLDGIFLMLSLSVWSQIEPRVGFSSDVTTTCPGSQVRFTGATTDLYYPGILSWDFGPGASPSTASGYGPVFVTYASPGTYTVTLGLYVPETGTTVIETIPDYMTVHPNTSVILSSPATTIDQAVCENSPIVEISYTIGGWPGLGTVYGITSGVNVLNEYGLITISGNPMYSGIYDYEVQADGYCGIASANGRITVYPTPGIWDETMNYETSTVCSGSSKQLTYTGSPAAVDPWLSSDQTVATVDNNGIVTGLSPGTTIITYKDSNGCSTTLSLTVKPLPEAPAAESNSPVLLGETITLGAGTIQDATYSWTGPNNFTSSQQYPVITDASDAMEGIYSVTATVDGCTGPAGTTEVTVNNIPVITEGESIIVTCDEDNIPVPFSLTLNVTDADGNYILWSFSRTPYTGQASMSGHGNSRVISYIPSPNFYGYDSFEIMVSDQLGGEDYITVNVTVNPVNDAPVVAAPMNDQSHNAFFSTMDIDLAGVFTDPEIDPLTLTAISSDESVVSVSVDGTTLTLTGAGQGRCIVTVTASDGLLSTDEMFSFKICNSDAIQDIEGYYYNIIAIGSQLWMAENLRTTKYSNGDLIGTTVPVDLNIGPVVNAKYQWPAYGMESNVGDYGRLYTQSVVTDDREICPVGWHVPSDAEWTTLTTYLGGVSIAGGKLKETGTEHWTTPNTGATNESGFTALPVDYRRMNGIFGVYGSHAYWWSSTSNRGRCVSYNGSFVVRNTWPPNYGFSVRCVKEVIAQQSIDLSEGWNMLSFAVEPSDMSMRAIVDPLINSGILLKVQDENGDAIERLSDPIGWIDNIGQMSVTEGYKIKVTANTNQGFSGRVVALPFDISLISGWNIIGYPAMNSQSSSAVFGPLIADGSLLKVQDEHGNAIEQLPDPIGWIDNIVNLMPGKGYKIKTTIDTKVTISSPVKGESPIVKAMIVQPTHFKPNFKGNGLDHMNIYIKSPTIGGVGLIPGDEIGVFDGGLCVGARVYDDLSEEYLPVIVSLNDPTTQAKDGYTEGNTFELRLWDNQAGVERKPRSLELNKGYNNTFKRLGTSVLGVDFEAVPTTFLGDAYPNPSAEKTTFTFQLAVESKVKLEIFNMMGDLVRVLVDEEMPEGSHEIEWDNQTGPGNKAKTGIYFYRLRVNEFSQTRQLVIH